MKIALVAPFFESVPPKLYGGTERIVSFLTEDLVQLGHDVTLFASGDSVTEAKLVPIRPIAVRLDKVEIKDPAPHLLRMLEQVYRELGEAEVVHFHLDYIHFPFVRRDHRPTVTTMHGRLDLPDLIPVFDEYSEVPVVSISDSQRQPLPQANWVGTIYHGLPENLYQLENDPEDYLLFLGRICREKRLDRAIEIAKRTNHTLKVAAKIDAADQEYYETEIKPLMDDPLIDFIGEVNEQQKVALLGKAKALLFPIDWPEPFGLVQIEAMACGTPTIAFPHGSVPEIIRNGRGGYVVDSVDEAVKVLAQIDRFDRKICRAEFEQRFSARRMAMDYVKLYQSLKR